VEPAVYTGVTNDMRIAREEIFGPVVVVIGFDTETEAVELANDSGYGLVGGVFTADMSRAIRVAEAIEAHQHAHPPTMTLKRQDGNESRAVRSRRL
jgi:aldehyde dehydrogenase (NAD+)